jgi:hypothetical protein
MRANDARSAGALIESARRSAERIGVEGESDLAARLASEIIRRARVAAALHLAGQAQAIAAAANIPSPQRDAIRDGMVLEIMG